ncbi:MAG TPA: hypothetical protein VG711_02340 [Phycisphaerales bacterium]|nr:hypothetical protein [Phycisphaerales bacterium]
MSFFNDGCYHFVNVQLRQLTSSAWLVALVVAAPVSAACSGDVTGNHTVDINDLTAVITSWGNCSGCDADLNGDHSVNIDDLTTIITNWGECSCTAQSNCVSVTPLWCEDWNLNNYSRWSDDYDHNVTCAPNGFASDKFITPGLSHKSRVTCATSDSHRGYGGLRFQGNAIIPVQQSSTGGTNAPNGVLVTFYSWLSTSYTFNTSKWISFMTVTDDCSNNWNNVITLNIDDSSMRVKPVHVTSVSYASGAPAMPLSQWVRTKVYINYNTGAMHVWQNGRKICSATFTRDVHTMCQWHFGLYASGPNDNITLYEEDLSIVKLNQPLTNFTDEPWFDTPLPCSSLP